jgi:hypothetical protein
MSQHDFNKPVEWYKDEAGFAEELARGRKTQIRIAMRLIPLGLWVRVEPFKERKGLASQDPKCQDDQDVEVEGGHMLEVKGRALKFEGAGDYPYPTVFLGRESRWNARKKLPCAVVIVSEITDATLVIPYDTRPQWEKNETFDRRRQFIEHGLGAPLSCVVSWERLVEHLTKRKHKNL